MDIEPEKFNSFLDKYNENQHEEAYLIALDDIGQGDHKYDIVLDIGCGTGSVTSVMDSRLNVGHIYAIDIDEKMIAFAKHNHSKGNITYILQDFGAEFDSMAPELRALEGKVDLIVTYYCLHRIENKERVANNMSRLLAKGGKVCASIHCSIDEFADLTGDEKAVHEREWMKVPAVDIQHNQWLNAFKSVDFRVIIDKQIEHVYKMTLAHFEQYFVPLIVTSFRSYFVNRKDVKKMKAFEQKLSAKIISNTLSKQYTDKTTGAVMVQGQSTLWRFVLQK